ncbi:MAG: group II intron reverse transcriptase/maturase [Minicystis sp.]
MTETPGFDTISPKVQQIAKLAKEAPGLAFTTLAHYIDIDWLKEAYRRTRKDGAVGVDGQRADDYAANLESNLGSLLERAKSGTYRAPPVRRVHIPKSDGQTRPIGIPTFEDKVLQRAVTMVLEAIYEQDFLDCSYGFRPRRSAHGALGQIWEQAMSMHGGWVLEIDIRKFFDTLDHEHLRSILCRRVRDGVLLRLIGKWLNAGVLEEGALSYPDSGSPQGGVISPMLANVYLHEVLDVWFEEEVKPRLKGHAFLIRYADDAVLVFSEEDDARRVQDVLPKRFGKYGLTLHPEKTRLVPFERPLKYPRKDAGPTPPGRFDFLGFTHVWTRSIKGSWVIRRRTAKDRFARALTRVWDWCKTHRHQPIKEQWRTLIQKVRGHYRYYGIIGNSWSLDRFHGEVRRIWKRWLDRRSQRGFLSWKEMLRLLEQHPLPRAQLSRRALPA